MTITNPRKYLLILGAGASMSLTPYVSDSKAWSDNKSDRANANNDLLKHFRLPSGTELIGYVANFYKIIRENICYVDSSDAFYYSEHFNFYKLIDDWNNNPDRRFTQQIIDSINNPRTYALTA